ncbi:MAG: hypothetical protein ACI92W_000886 [Paraglaciecola sp.]|jgi:hypothetical protein
MIRPILICLSAIILFSISALAQDRELRDHDSFSGIKVGGGLDVYITQSKAFEVEVVTSGDLGDIVTEVNRGVLEIRQDSKTWFSYNENTRINVSLPLLEYLHASGGSDVISTGIIRGDMLKIRSSGGSDVELEITYQSLDVNCSGGSDLELSGEVDILELETSGGSDFDGFDLIAQDATLNTSGGSDANVHVRNKIQANASGASDITYRGSPKYVDVNSSGGADINGGR